MEGNIGLYFYRGYYQDYFGPRGLKTKYKDNEKRQQEEAKKKNDQITQYKDISLNKCLCVGNAKSFSLTTVYPGLYTGSGYSFGAGLEGEFQLGFLFDHTTGLPYLPGSSVKGTIRSVFPNYTDMNSKTNESKNTKHKGERVTFIWNEYFNNMNNDCFTENFSMNLDKTTVIKEIELEIFEGRDIVSGQKEEYLSVYNRDIFHDVYIAEPVKGGKTKGRFLGTDYITPHKSAVENPTPLPFLKILPGVTVNFQFQLHDGFYLTAKGKLELFKRILLDFGVGAKTNVGYGQFTTG